MAFSFFRKKSEAASKTLSSQRASKSPSLPSLNAAVTADVSVVGGKSRLLFTTPNAEDGAGRLLRLDSSVDMKLGDLGVSDTSGNVRSRSSQLCKNLDEVLHDQDALAYFISYLQSLNADNLVRFWLDVEAFRLAAERTTSIRLAADRVPPAEPVGLASVRTPAVEAIRLAGDQTPPTSKYRTSEKTTLSEDPACSKTPEVTQQRVPTNYCGHASSSASDSPKAVGRLPAHGEVVVSTDAAVPSSSAAPSGVCRPLVDCCPASNPSITAVTQSSQLEAVQQTDEVLVSSDVDDDSLTISSVSTDNMTEPPHKVIERDAMAIFTKYLSLDCSHPVAVSDDLRVATVKLMCHDDGVNTDCFNACQQAVLRILDKEYFPGFKQSVYHSKHQIDVLTGSRIYLSDILYDDTAFSYFTEFMEAESASAVLQCFLDLDNFHELLASTSSTSHHVTFDCSTAQDDAIVIYDKYFSLQATGTLRFDDSVRQEVESNICSEHGVTADCFSTPRHIVYCYMERTYLQSFLCSDMYIKYLSDLINIVHLAHDTVVFPQQHAVSDSNSDRSVASGHSESVSTRNTLLAMDTRGQHIKRAVNRIGDDMRIDSSLFDPDNLWHRPSAGAMRFGRVDTLGQYISEFDPEPDSGKKGFGSLFARNDDKAHLEEELALQVAKMIITDVTMTTRCHDPTSRRHDPDVTTTTHSHDPASQRHDPDSQGHDPSPSRGASFEL